MGPEFIFEARYAMMLTIFYVCLFLSLGMPLFYVIGFFSFIIALAIDKYLCKLWFS
jgi:hypothetical protein